MNYKVVVQPQAGNDAQAIFEWLSNRSPAGAQSWYDAYYAALVSLEMNPDRNAVAPDSPIDGIVVRNMSFQTRHGRPYRLLYAILDSEKLVHVLHVRAPGQMLLG